MKNQTVERLSLVWYKRIRSPQGHHPLTLPVGTWPKSPLAPSWFSHLGASYMGLVSLWETLSRQVCFVNTRLPGSQGGSTKTAQHLAGGTPRSTWERDKNLEQTHQHQWKLGACATLPADTELLRDYTTARDVTSMSQTIQCWTILPKIVARWQSLYVYLVLDPWIINSFRKQLPRRNFVIR